MHLGSFCTSYALKYFNISLTFQYFTPTYEELRRIISPTPTARTTITTTHHIMVLPFSMFSLVATECLAKQHLQQQQQPQICRAFGLGALLSLSFINCLPLHNRHVTANEQATGESLRFGWLVGCRDTTGT